MTIEAPPDIRNRTDRELIRYVECIPGGWNIAKELASRLEVAVNAIELMETEIDSLQLKFKF